MTMIAPSYPPATVNPRGLTISLPIPPSINHQYATVNGRRVLSAVGRRYKLDIGQQILLALSRSQHKHALLTRLRAEFLGLSIRCYFTSLLRRDIDGGLKITQDAVCEALGLNDNRVLELHVYKEMTTASPSITLSISALSSAVSE